MGLAPPPEAGNLGIFRDIMRIEAGKVAPFVEGADGIADGTSCSMAPPFIAFGCSRACAL